jgi:hypothetical protein
MRDLLVQRAGYRRALEGILARADVPLPIREQRPLILSRFHLTSGCRWYALEQVSPAQHDLLRALLLTPDLTRTDGDASVLLDIVTRTAQDPLWVPERPHAYVDFVLDHLPSPLRGLGALRDRAHDALDGAQTVRAPGAA